MSIGLWAQEVVFIHICIMLLTLGQVMYSGRAPRTKETLPDFHERCRVARHSRVFRGLTGSQRTPGNWGARGVHRRHGRAGGTGAQAARARKRHGRAGEGWR